MLDRYRQVRNHSEQLCATLATEDFVPQPVEQVSPPKWHLAHTSWFFEQFVLIPYMPSYQLYHPKYNYLFNSYYETVGDRVLRHQRGNMSRPTVAEIYVYRKYVDAAMEAFLTKHLTAELAELVELGLNHEEQHQELFLTDIKYIFGHNPLYPAFSDSFDEGGQVPDTKSFISVYGGLYDIGHEGSGFCFDNELDRHQVNLEPFEIADHLVSNQEYLEFIKEGGYSRHQFWHSAAWSWIHEYGISKPLYWFVEDGRYFQFTMAGMKPLEDQAAVTHISYFEAFAFAEWKGMRLPTEFEWEVAQARFQWGERWEWTNSAYVAYPGYFRSAGAVGEYNGKFMVNQMVLRGASCATSVGHSRPSYRNFFHPNERWQFTGIRLAK